MALKEKMITNGEPDEDEEEEEEEEEEDMVVWLNIVQFTLP
uniref:Uncharacterized protein n=1 Tax=Anguilla anguilla TaxID=7936 RepID=A0A0E9P5L1_ANGAN